MKSFVILVAVLCCAICLAKEDKRNPAKSKLKRKWPELRSEMGSRHVKRANQTDSKLKRQWPLWAEQTESKPEMKIVVKQLNDTNSKLKRQRPELRSGKGSRLVKRLSNDTNSKLKRQWYYLWRSEKGSRLVKRAEQTESKPEMKIVVKQLNDTNSKLKRQRPELRSGKGSRLVKRLSNDTNSKLKRQWYYLWRSEMGSRLVKRAEQTECEIRHAEAENQGGIGGYVPQCEADGSFKPMQCSGSTGYCWCVDRYGCEISGTQVPPGGNMKPVCVKDESKCEKQRAEAENQGGVGTYVPQCEVDGSFNPVQCSGSTGYCWCVNFNGKEISGTKVPPGAKKPLCRNKTECEKQRDMAKNLESKGLLGVFVPQCEADGSFTPMQCLGSIVSCWCVDGNGQEIPGTETPQADGKPDCGVETECEKRRQVAENQLNQGMMGVCGPTCEPDGSYTPVQCCGSTGYCWCVNKYGCEIPDTEVPPGEERPNCSG